AVDLAHSSLAGDLLQATETLPWPAVLEPERQRTGLGDVRERTVGLPDPLLLEKLLIGASRRGTTREDEQPARHPIEPVDRHDGVLPAFDAQARHDAFAYEGSVRRRGEKVRLVDDDEVVVLVQDLHLEGDPLLGRERLVEGVEAAGD